MHADCVLELPNDLRAIERTVRYLMQRSRKAGFSDERLDFNFRVGLTEALANAMLYGNARDPDKRVRVEARLSAELIAVRVTDEGRGFDPEAVPDPTLPANRSRTCGRGLFLIRQLMDEVDFNPQGNSITMVLYQDRQPAGTRRVAR
jgi:serine/threonine-protein kinase RsbW